MASGDGNRQIVTWVVGDQYRVRFGPGSLWSCVALFVTPQTMAFYLGRNFDPSGVGHYSDPVFFVDSRKKLKRGVSNDSDGRFGPVRVAHYQGGPSQDPGPLLLAGVYRLCITLDDQGVCFIGAQRAKTKKDDSR